MNACLRKGKGWHLFTNAEWMAVAQWSKRNGTRPHGNTGDGCYHRATYERGLPANNVLPPRASGQDLAPARRPWNHNRNASGTSRSGRAQTSERVGGLRLMDGVFQIIPHNDAALYDEDLLKIDSRRWRAVTTDGYLAAHGEPNTPQGRRHGSGRRAGGGSPAGQAWWYRLKLNNPSYLGPHIPTAIRAIWTASSA